jgi:hypothetical protein
MRLNGKYKVVSTNLVIFAVPLGEIWKFPKPKIWGMGKLSQNKKVAQ